MVVERAANSALKIYATLNRLKEKKKMSEPLLNALIAAEAHIRVAPHGDNCFLHDDGGEYDACFCGKDALLSHLEGVLEDAQLAAAPVAAPADKRTIAQIAHEVHHTCMRIPGANFYTAAEMALEQAIAIIAAPVAAQEPMTRAEISDWIVTRTWLPVTERNTRYLEQFANEILCRASQPAQDMSTPSTGAPDMSTKAQIVNISQPAQGEPSDAAMLDWLEQSTRQFCGNYDGSGFRMIGSAVWHGTLREAVAGAMRGGQPAQGERQPFGYVDAHGMFYSAEHGPAPFPSCITVFRA